MKLKSKLILAATGLLVLSGAATGTGIFAWFTANTTAFAKLSDFKASTNMEDLKIEFVTSGFNTMVTTGTPTDQAVGLTYHTGVTGSPDCSSNGTSFVTAVANADNTEITQTSTAHTNSYPIADSGNDIYYHEFELKFSTAKDSVSTGVFLGKETTFHDNTQAVNGTDANEIRKAYRVAVYSKTTKYWKTADKIFVEEGGTGIETIDAAGSLLAYYAPYRSIASGVEGKEQAKYLPAGVQGAAADLYNSFDNGTAQKVQYLGVDNYTGDNNDADFGSTYTNTTKLYGYLGQAGSGANALSVFVRIWCEGSDTAAINSSIDNLTTGGDTLNDEDTVKASLSFIGVNTNGQTIA